MDRFSCFAVTILAVLSLDLTSLTNAIVVVRQHSSEGVGIADSLPGKTFSRVVSRAHGKPTFVTGNLGKLSGSNDVALQASGGKVLRGAISSRFGGTGRETFVPRGKISRDKAKNVHIRFSQEINGYRVKGAALVLHAKSDGDVFAVNGEFVKPDAVASKAELGASAALEIALAEACLQGTWLGKPTLSVVRGDQDGRGYLAWEQVVQYIINGTGPDVGLHRDIVFADAKTGRRVAIHPKIHGFGEIPSLVTQTCNERTRNCNTVSTSSERISTPDAAINAAHNNAIATFEYYNNRHGRNSIDDAGMTLHSRVHYGKNYNNAFWDGSQMTYGDGDGVTFIPLCLSVDVVAHELTHGVTERSSGLIYQYESGALNEAWSDIFGALVDRQEGATRDNIWLLGESIYTPSIEGDALRSMSDPASFGDYDFWPERYSGTSDNGGVHWNSGIANLAFVLLVEGGVHPRGKTSISVHGIGFEDAADIFYQANANCMTPSSDFACARYCTALVSAVHEAAVHAAWDAVGVPNEPAPAPKPTIALNDGVTLGGQGAVDGELQQYTLEVAAGQVARCAIACDNGDADLYLRFGEPAVENPSSSLNACSSAGSSSNEECTTGAASEAVTLYAGVHAWTAYTSLAITCNVEDATDDCTGAGSCTQDSDCCSGSCSRGKPAERKCMCGREAC